MLSQRRITTFDDSAIWNWKTLWLYCGCSATIADQSESSGSSPNFILASSRFARRLSEIVTSGLTLLFGHLLAATGTITAVSSFLSWRSPWWKSAIWQLAWTLLSSSQSLLPCRRKPKKGI